MNNASLFVICGLVFTRIKFEDSLRVLEIQKLETSWNGFVKRNNLKQ